MTFNDKIADIDRLLESIRQKWTGMTHFLGFEDLCQIIRLHIYSKFNQWDQTRPFDPWCAQVIENQRINQIRNHFGRLTPPCVKGSKGCPFNTGENNCQFTQSGKKDSGCPAYAKWAKSKKNAYELKVAAPLEDFDGASREGEFDIVKSVDKFHERMKEYLTPRLYEAYCYFYVDHLSDGEAANKLGFKTKEKNRGAGYRQIANMKSEIFKIAKDLVHKFDLEY